MPRNIGSGKTGELCQIPYIALALAQQIEQLQACGFGKRLKVGRHIAHRFWGKVFHSGAILGCKSGRDFNFQIVLHFFKILVYYLLNYAFS